MPALTNKYLNYSPILPPVLYHYCSINTFISIIENQCVWLSDAEKTNDETELKWLFSEMKEILDNYLSKYSSCYSNELLLETKKVVCKIIEGLIFKKMPITKNSKSFLTCFSEADDLLSQWRGYGNDGKGLAIGFNTELFNEFITNRFYTMTKVIYDREKMTDFLYLSIGERLKNAIDSCIDENNNEYNLKELYTNMSMLIYSIWQEGFVYKNYMFAEEQEWRIFRKLQKDNFSTYDGVDYYGYTDCLDGFFINNETHLGNFTRSALKFRSTGDDLRLYFELGFEKCKKEIIKEIIIGPKSKITEFDLKIFLAQNGYIEDIFSDSIIIRKSKCPYVER